MDETEWIIHWSSDSLVTWTLKSSKSMDGAEVEREWGSTESGYEIISERGGVTGKSDAD